jgi:hypothetical protein
VSQLKRPLETTHSELSIHGEFGGQKTYCLADSLQSELILMMRDAFDWFSRSSGSFSCSCRLLRAVGKSEW